ncbi:hypothetical protein [Soonwooa sp.]|uniref:DUF6630 family protein n=1 Tax=Soonwooa sp. TaxID=1938592 RepID=UPI0026245859|nr:hypothetical protein [Soonwooa sp.]
MNSLEILQKYGLQEVGVNYAWIDCEDFEVSENYLLLLEDLATISKSTFEPQDAEILQEAWTDDDAYYVVDVVFDCFSKAQKIRLLGEEWFDIDFIVQINAILKTQNIDSQFYPIKTDDQTLIIVFANSELYQQLKAENIIENIDVLKLEKPDDFESLELKQANETDRFIHENCIGIDWKMSIDDTIYNLKNKLPQYRALFENQNIKSLVDNYHFESADVYMPALGQELSALDFLLYEIEEDSDRYCLYLTPKNDAANFETLATEKNIPFILLKQDRKEIGQSASVLKAASELKFEYLPMKGRADFAFPMSVFEKDWISLGQDSNGDGIYIGHDYSFVNLESWPPHEHSLKLEYQPSGINYFEYSKTNNLFCAVFSNVKLDENNNRIRSSSVKISSNPYKIENWESVVCEEEIPTLAKVFWIDEHVILAHRNKAWLIENAAKGGRNCTKIWEDQKPADSNFYPCKVSIHAFKDVLSINGQVLFLNEEETTTGSWLFKKTIKKFVLKNLMAIGDPIHQGAISFENLKLVYLCANTLVEVDLKNRKVLKSCQLERMDKKTEFKMLNDDWAVVYRYAYAHKDYDLAQFWNVKKDTWLRLKFGSLGKHDFKDILQHPQNYVLISSDNGIIKIDDLIENLEQDSGNHFQQNWKTYE